ncbi:hypothetical protein Tco_0386093 [Tanacetum coccineum]
MDESSEDAWSHYSPFTNPEDHEQEPQINISNIQDGKEPNDNNNIGNFSDNPVPNNIPYYANEEVEQYEEDGCELLRNPRQEPTVSRIERFEVIKYSFRPGEKYVAIKECEHDNRMRTKEDACHAYKDIFCIMDEGWFVTRAE